KAYSPSQLRGRAIYADGFNAMNDNAIGAWAMTTWSFVGFADFYAVSGETFTSSQGITYLVVEQAFSALGFGLLDFDNGTWMLLFDKETSNYHLYQFDIVAREARGLYWIYPKTG